MFKDDKVLYGGDIQQILSNLTCNNYGFVDIENKKLIENLKIFKLSLESPKPYQAPDYDMEGINFDVNIGLFKWKMWH